MGYSQGLDCAPCHFVDGWNHYADTLNICPKCFGLLFANVKVYGMQHFLATIEWNTETCDICSEIRMCLTSISVCDHCIDRASASASASALV